MSEYPRDLLGYADSPPDPQWPGRARITVNFALNYDEGGEREAPRMMTVAVHCRLVGKPGRAAAFARFIDYVLSHDRVWVCRRLDIARHWHEHHPSIEQGPT